MLENENTDNEQKWFQERINGLTSSDAPIIMGSSRHKKTKAELWNEKFNKIIPEQDPNFQQRTGQMIESWARPGIEFLTGLKFSPAFFKHKDMPFLMATLNGYNKENNQAWQCHYVAKEVFDGIDKSLDKEKHNEWEVIPKDHHDKLMHIFLVTGVPTIIYTAIKRWKDENGKWQKRAVNLFFTNGPYAEHYIKSELAPKLLKFWKSVQDGSNPYDDFKVDYKAAFESFVGWIKDVKTLSPGEIVNAINNFPVNPDLSKYPLKEEIIGPEKELDKVLDNAFDKLESEKDLKPADKFFNEINSSGLSDGLDKKVNSDEVTPIDIKQKKLEWDSMSKREQTIQAKSNIFKNPNTGRKPRGWDSKPNEARIKYLRDESEKAKGKSKKIFTEMADEMEVLIK